MSRIQRAFIGPGRTTVNIRVPKGMKNVPGSGKYGAALQKLQDDKRLSNSNRCIVAFFKRKSGKIVAAQRCEGRRLKATNKKQCRNSKKKFIKCGRGRR